MLRAVLDTNILLSAFWSQSGAAHQILRELLAGRWIAVIENHLSTEYEEILKRHTADIPLTFDEIDRALDGLCFLAERRNLCPGWIPVLPDPATNRSYNSPLKPGYPTLLPVMPVTLPVPKGSAFR